MSDCKLAAAAAAVAAAKWTRSDELYIQLPDTLISLTLLNNFPEYFHQSGHPLPESSHN